MAEGDSLGGKVWPTDSGPRGEGIGDDGLVGLICVLECDLAWETVAEYEVEGGGLVVFML